ncbi:hypothetical protein FAZ95_09225 [Trinickia violacea]|uniref:Transmembrane protein n=1 Tax=Trinickia violacea TaxID=2571746 RepID=A0A4P8IQI5_9BURK|nr:hypothetical protein [Trinickia violacea]QCP49343.1 hypothetical protein FAZ95_09225 [Trinickia violacea]
MKPLLRAVLVVYTLLYLLVGLLYLATPWTSLHRALQLAVIEPAMAGQLLGLALFGLASLAFQGVINGAMTTAVARVIGHITWLAGVLILVWLIAFGMSLSPGYGALFNALGGVALLIIGMGGVRLARSVRRGERTAKVAAKAYAEQGAAPSRAEAARAAEPSLSPTPQQTAAPEAVPAARAAEPAVRYRFGTPAEGTPATGNAAPPPPLSASEKAARDAARDDAADLPGSPRPPFHG